MAQDESTRSTGNKLFASIVRAGRRPRILLLLLAAWSLVAALTHVFVNSGLLLNIQERELGGALGGLALSFNAVPLAVLYVYCWRDPYKFRHVFWLAFVHQAAIVAGVLYHWVIDTYSFENVVIPVVVSAALGALAFVQIFEPETESRS